MEITLREHLSRAGSAKSAAKTAAVRENAKKGGWPKGRPRKTEMLLRIKEPSKTDEIPDMP
jgi:hypothetical protein